MNTNIKSENQFQLADLDIKTDLLKKPMKH